MILHLVNDEKIINRTISIFDEAFPSENLFVVCNKTGGFKYVTKQKNVLNRVEFLEKKNQYKFSKVYIHFLNKRKMDIIKELSLDDAAVYWIVWGADLYNKLLEPVGFKIFDNSSSYFKRVNRFNHIRKRAKNFLRKKKAKQTISFIKEHIDYIVTDSTENDYDYLLKYYPELKHIPWKDFFYYPIDEILSGELINASVFGNDIMIGNSASQTNNHEYAMKHLLNLDLSNRKVYLPLSYSVKKDYLKAVVKFGKKNLKSNFTPIFDFMPLKAYNELQASISVAIFGNWRQEAIGNILISLYLGAKVFLPSQNPIVEWANIHGLKVFTLEEMTQDMIDTPLSNEYKNKNKEILIALYNKERMIQLIRNL